MVARFDYCCKECGSNTFVASGIANDDPIGEGGDEMRSTLRFHCSQCSALAVELKTRMDGRNELTQNLSTFRAPWDPKRHVP